MKWLHDELARMPDADALLKECQAEDKAERERTGRDYDCAYLRAFGGLSWHYTNLKRLFKIALDNLDEQRRKYDALTMAVEYQKPDEMDELYAAADVHEANATAGGEPVRRELCDDEIKLGRVIQQSERCTNCDEFDEHKEGEHCRSCAEMFAEEVEA